MAMEFTVHCLICNDKWIISSRFDTRWEAIHCYTVCKGCAEKQMAAWEEQMRPKVLPLPTRHIRVEDKNDPQGGGHT